MASIDQFDPQVVQQLYTYWSDKTGNPAMAAGIVGNLLQESNGNPNAVNQGEGAHGIAQWRESRHQALQELAAERGTAWNDLDTQNTHLWNELQTTEREAYDALQGVTDPAEAAAIFDQRFERSAGTERGVRQAYAQQIAETYGDGSLVDGAVGNSLNGTMLDDPNVQVVGQSAMNLQGSTANTFEASDLYARVMENEEAQREDEDAEVFDLTTGLRTLSKGLGQMAQGKPVDVSDIGERADKVTQERRERLAASRQKAATASYLMKMPGGKEYAVMVAQGADPEAALQMYKSAYITQAMQERGISADAAAAELSRLHERGMADDQRKFTAEENQHNRNQQIVLQQLQDTGALTRLQITQLNENNRHASTLGYNYATLAQDQSQFKENINRLLANDETAKEQFNKTFDLDEKKFAEAMENTDWQQEFQNKEFSQVIQEFQTKTGIDLSKLNLDERQLQQLITDQDRRYELNKQETASLLDTNEARIRRIATENNLTEEQVTALQQQTIRDQTLFDYTVKEAQQKLDQGEGRGEVQKQIVLDMLNSRTDDPEAQALAKALADAPAEGFSDPSLLSNLGSIMKKAGTTSDKTADIKNFEYAMQNPIFAEFLERKLSKSPELQKILPEALARMGEKSVNEAKESANTARSALGTVNEMSGILDRGVRTGSFQEMIKPIVQGIASTLGLSEENTQELADQENFAGLANSLLPMLRQNYPGAMTNWEGQKFIDSFANLGLTKEANEQFIDFYKNMYNRQIAKAGAMENYFAENGSVVGFDDAWEKRVEEQWADTSPLYLSPHRMTPESAKSNMDSGALRPGVTIYVPQTTTLSDRTPIDKRDKDGKVIFEAVKLTENGYLKLRDKILSDLDAEGN